MIESMLEAERNDKPQYAFLKIYHGDAPGFWYYDEVALQKVHEPKAKEWEQAFKYISFKYN